MWTTLYQANVNFAKALEFLNSLTSYEKKMPFALTDEGFDLKKLKFFTAALGLDLTKFRFVHVAGSKGKGTVCRLIHDYLFADGRKVGLFTSPHILDVRERIVLNGEMIGESDFAREIFKLERFSAMLEISLTYFECLFLLALLIFDSKKVEFVVLEVGLGGRLDATNVIYPEVACITHIEKEHTEILGESYEEILREKLGICKKGVPVLVGEQKPEVLDLIGATLEDFYLCSDNFSLAEKALGLLLGNVKSDIWSKVSGNFEMLGRFTKREVAGEMVIFDIAHTEASIKMLVDRLLEEFSGRKFMVLFSCLKGKNLEGMARQLKRLEADFAFCVCHEERGLMPEEIKDVFGEGEILAELDLPIKKDRIIVVTGSNFLVSKVLARL